MSTKKEEIIEAAHELFWKNGFFATGVDQIIAESGVSKRTMYKYFDSKTDLVIAVIDSYKKRVRAAWEEALERDESPKEKILNIFRTAFDFLEGPGTQGCLAVNVMGEYSGKEVRIQKSCEEFKKWEIETFRDLAKNAKVANPDKVALKLFLIHEGIFSYAQVYKTAPPETIFEYVEEAINEK